jgi:L-arabinose isomerase
VIDISIGTTVKIRRRSPEVDKPLIKTSHVSLYRLQIKKLEEMARKEGKATAQLIRDAVKRFLNKGTFERNTFNFDASSAKGMKRVYLSTYFRIGLGYVK